MLFNNGISLPIYSRVTAGYDLGQLAKILLIKYQQMNHVCSSHPRGVSENATFLVDVDVVYFNDLKSDDMVHGK